MKRQALGVLSVAAGVLCTPEARAQLVRGRECAAVGDSVGETCDAYGSAWSIERLSPFTSRFGFRYGEFTTKGARFNDNAPSRNRPRGYRGYRFDGELLGVPTLAAAGVDGGLTYFVVDQLYVGAECGFLFGGARTRSFTEDGFSFRDSGGMNVMLWHAGLPVGYRIPLGRASLRGEVLGGAIIATVGQRVTGPESQTAQAGVAGRWLVEPRIAADIWLTQHFSFGAYAGVNVVDSAARAVGLTLTFHNRAFDGDMSLW